MSYKLFPKNKPSLIDECCSCPPEKQIPVSGVIDIKLERGTPVGIKKFWCAACGLYFSIKDQDKYFPAKVWIDKLPEEGYENE